MKSFASKNKLLLKKHSRATKEKEISAIHPSGGELLAFHMSRHVGTPAKPAVSVGQKVSAGQIVGIGHGDFSLNIYCGVSGIVKEIRQFPTQKGMAEAVIVESDGKMEKHPVQDSIENIDPSDLILKDFIDIIKSAGVVSQNLPVHTLLDERAGSIKHFFVNTEDEPFCTANYRLMAEKADEIKAVTDLMKRLYDGANVIFSSNTSTVPGAVCLNLDALLAIHAAVFHGLPMTRRIITLAGGAVKNPGNYDICLGALVSDIIKAAGGFSSTPGKIVLGGAMTGFAIPDLNEAVSAKDAAILAFDKGQSHQKDQMPCIRCGSCPAACPAALLPYSIAAMAARREIADFEAAGGMNCLNCGACSFVCPSKRHLTHLIATAQEMSRHRAKEENNVR